MLTEKDFAALRIIVAEAIATSLLTEKILTLREARVYTKHAKAAAIAANPEAGRTAFNVWCRKWGVKSASNGRYSKGQLDVALGREARSARFR